jgi:uncharacterized membrane protein YdjX (TVP38/TMEM64 family)
MMRVNKKEKILMLLTAAILLAIGIFAACNWSDFLHLFKEMVTGVAIVRENILDMGVAGVLIISLLIIIWFFFPVISSIPVQLASVVAYGLPFAIVHVSLSVFVASQIAFLLVRCFRVFHSPKQRKKQEEMEAKIRCSSRGIMTFLFLAYLAPFVPFMLIHIVAANSGMKWWKYALVTLLGPIPDVVTTLYLGSKIATTTSPATSLIVLLLVIGCVALAMIYKEKIIDWVFAPKKESEGENGK